MAKTFLKKLFRRASEHTVRLPPDQPAVVLSDPTTGLITPEDLAVEPEPGLFTVLSLHNHQILVRYLDRLPLPQMVAVDDPSAYFYVKPKPKTFEILPEKQFTLIVGNGHFIVEIVSILAYPPPDPVSFDATRNLFSPHEAAIPAWPSSPEERLFGMPHAPAPRLSRRRVSRRGMYSAITNLDTPSPPTMPSMPMPASPPSSESLSNSEIDDNDRVDPSNRVPTYSHFWERNRTPVTHIAATTGYMPTPQSPRASPRPRNADVAPVPPVPQTPPISGVMEVSTLSHRLHGGHLEPAPIPQSTMHYEMKDLPPVPSRHPEARRRALKTPATSPNYQNSIKETPDTPTPAGKRPKQEPSPLLREHMHNEKQSRGTPIGRRDSGPATLSRRARETEIAVPSTRTPLDETPLPFVSKVKQTVKFLDIARPEATSTVENLGQDYSPAPFPPPGLENERNYKLPNRPRVFRKLPPVSLPAIDAPYPVVVPRPPSPPRLHQPQAKRPAVDLLGSKAVLPNRTAPGRNTMEAGSAGPGAASIPPETALGLVPEQQTYQPLAPTYYSRWHKSTGIGLAPVSPQEPAYTRTYSLGRRRVSTTVSHSMGPKGMETVQREEEFWVIATDSRPGYPVPHARGNTAADTAGKRHDYGYGTPDIHGYAPARRRPSTAYSKSLVADPASARHANGSSIRMGYPPNAAILTGDSEMFETSEAVANGCWTDALQLKR